MMVLKLSELILAIGDDNVELQNLDHAADTLDWTAKKGTKITFGTTMAINAGGTEKMGLVIWLPRDKVEAALAKSKAAPVAGLERVE
jgi:hypothetical protein